MYKGYSESNLWWAVNKTSNEKIQFYYIQKNTYILDVVTVRIEAFFISGNKFLYACVKEVCLKVQPHFDTVHQLITVEVLWSQPVLQVGKQVAVSWSEIRTVRWAVEQLPVGMLWQCLSASSCMQTHCCVEALHRMSAFHAFCSEWPYTVFLAFHNTLLTLLWSLDAWIASALLSCPRMQLPSVFCQTTYV
jgi:hypothetical protein